MVWISDKLIYVLLKLLVICRLQNKYVWKKEVANPNQISFKRLN